MQAGALRRDICTTSRSWDIGGQMAEESKEEEREERETMATLAFHDRLHRTRAAQRRTAETQAIIRALEGSEYAAHGVPLKTELPEERLVFVDWADAPHRLRVTPYGVWKETRSAAAWVDERQVDAALTLRIQIAVGIAPAEHAEADPQVAAVAAVPHALSGLTLGSFPTVVQSVRNTVVTWHHPNRTTTQMLVSPRGVAFGPLTAHPLQYTDAAAWAVRLMCVFGYKRVETAAEAALKSALLARGSDARVRLTDAEWRFFVEITTLVDTALLMAPSLMVLFCDAMRRLEVSGRMEDLIRSKAAHRGRTLWQPPLDVDRVRNGAGQMCMLFWLAGQTLTPPRAAALFGQLPAIDAARGDAGETGLLPREIWAACLVGRADMQTTAALQLAKRRIMETRPASCLVRELFWTTTEHCAFIDAGGRYLPQTGAFLRDTIIGDTLGIPHNTPDAPTHGLTAAELRDYYATVILAAPMGTRKSTAIVHFLIHCVRLENWAMDAAGMRFVVQVTPRRALAAHATGALSRSGLRFEHYGNVTGGLTEHNRMVIQAESLHRLATAAGTITVPHILLLDEAAMVLMQLCSTATHGKNHRSNVEIFMQMVQKANIVIVADAFMTPAVYRMLAYLRGGAERNTDTIGTRMPGAHFIELPTIPAAGRMRRVATLEDLTHHITRAAGGGRVVGTVYKPNRVACCIASATAAESIAKWLEGYNKPGSLLWADRRCALGACARAHGLPREWVDDAQTPLRIKLFMGGDADTSDALHNVEEVWGPAEADVVIYTTTAACGVSYVGAGDGVFDAVFFYGCAGSDVCRVQGQMVRRIRHSRSNMLTYCLEGRSGGAPSTSGRVPLAAHVSQRALVVEGLLTPETVGYHAPAFLRSMLVEHENEVAICRLWFNDIMVRYLELAGFREVDEAEEEGTRCLAPDFEKLLVEFDDVTAPAGAEYLTATERGSLLEQCRVRARNGYRLRYDQQLWVTKHDLLGYIGQTPETKYAWAVVVDPRDAKFRSGFTHQVLTLADELAVGPVAAVVAGSYIEAVPPRLLFPVGIKRLLDDVTAVGGPPLLTPERTTLTSDVLEALQGRLQHHHAESVRTRTALNIYADGAVTRRAVTDMLKRALHTGLGGMLVVSQMGRERVPTAVAGVKRRRGEADAPERTRVRLRQIEVDLRPWWRVRQLLQASLVSQAHAFTATAEYGGEDSAPPAPPPIPGGDLDTWWQTILDDWECETVPQAAPAPHPEAPVVVHEAGAQGIPDDDAEAWPAGVFTQL